MENYDFWEYIFVLVLVRLIKKILKLDNKFNDLLITEKIYKNSLQ